MKRLFRTTALAALLLAALPSAQAATYSFSGMMDSGSLIGQSFTGLFSFDDSALTKSGEEYLGVGSLSMNFLGNVWGVSHFESGSVAEVKFYNGLFAGLSYSATWGTTGFSSVPGSFDTSDAFVAYDSSLGLSGAGNVIYAAVPEPESYAMFLAGLGLMGLIARRRAKGF
ncbi:PEP-CTERM sorting domain-containing protein [Ferribacterium limneticum]|uniref:PEP-CTERM sorting domain-containing protein n=1 Tax=Ferribacterium limneticum TaxID=76259 RepID=UPI001CFBCF31|nr:PEP-CTERM sorting domain-containing protein [Ferribacterium limneticum]